MRVEESFARLFGRPPSDDERERIQKIRDALDISDNDALWAVILALQYHKALYDDVPRQIAESAQRSAQKIVASAAKIAEQAAEKAVERTAKKLLWQIVATVSFATIVAVAVSAGACYWIATKPSPSVPAAVQRHMPTPPQHPPMR